MVNMLGSCLMIKEMATVKIIKILVNSKVLCFDKREEDSNSESDKEKGDYRKRTRFNEI